MRMYGFKSSTSIDRDGATVQVSITFEDKATAEVAVELLRQRHRHGALTLDLQRPRLAQIEGRCEQP